MIDPSEATTRTVTLFSFAGGVMSYTPSEDLTLRQVAGSSYVVSFDPNCPAISSSPADIVLDEFYLDSADGYNKSQLAFPVPQGRPIFVLVPGGGRVILIFS